MESQIKEKKITIYQLAKDFNSRHDFSSEDLDVLESKYGTISFKNIPEAWVVLIDKMISKAGSDSFESIEQHFGFLVVKCLKKAKKAVDFYEKKLYLIDKDLHEGLR